MPHVKPYARQHEQYKVCNISVPATKSSIYCGKETNFYTQLYNRIKKLSKLCTNCYGNSEDGVFLCQ